MKALLLPLKGGPHARTADVTCIARTSRDKITVEMPGGRFIAVHRFLLRTQDGLRKFDPEEYARLPWRGSGKDPLTHAGGKLFNDKVSP